MRTDLPAIITPDEVAVGLKLLTSHRLDVIHDRVRAINRLRAVLMEYFPALERSFDYSKNKAALLLLTGYANPASIRRMGASRLAGWLKTRGARNSAGVAQTAVDAAKANTSVLPSEAAGSLLVAKLAATITAIDADLAGIDALIAEQLKNHKDAEILMSMPGFGPYLAASFLGQIGGTLDAFDSAGKLASLAGLAPVPRDSGRISGNLHRPRRFNRRLLRTCYLAAFRA
jgi:transposase